MEYDSTNDLAVLTEIIGSLKRLEKEDQIRILQAVATFLNIVPANTSASIAPILGLSSNPGKNSFSEDRVLSPKDFMRDKNPQTDIEKATCLAYYLTHYRDAPHFKTLDISALNTEAALPKFSNASIAVDNATKAGYLVQAVKGSKQISSVGETYVQLLPDRDAAKNATQNMGKKRIVRKPVAKKTSRIIKKP